MLIKKFLNENEIMGLVAYTQKNYVLNIIEGYEIILNNNIASTLRIINEITEEGKRRALLYRT